MTSFDHMGMHTHTLKCTHCLRKQTSHSRIQIHKHAPCSKYCHHHLGGEATSQWNVQGGCCGATHEREQKAGAKQIAGFRECTGLPSSLSLLPTLLVFCVPISLSLSSASVQKCWVVLDYSSSSLFHSTCLLQPSRFCSCSRQ